MPRRRTLLAAAAIGVVPAFAAVNIVVAAARSGRQALSSEWAARGARELDQGRSIAAAEDFRIAQEYARDRGQYRLQLARALLAAGRLPEARAQFLTLWTERPGSGVINLALARIAASTEDTASAIRYYHGAIDGSWDGQAADARRGARLELARMLVGRGERTQAQAELVALSGDPPREAQFLAEIAQLRVLAALDPLPAHPIAAGRIVGWPGPPSRGRR